MDVVAVRAAGRTLVIGVVLALVHDVMPKRHVLDDIAGKMSRTGNLERRDDRENPEHLEQNGYTPAQVSSSALGLSDARGSSS